MCLCLGNKNIIGYDWFVLLDLKFNFLFLIKKFCFIVEWVFMLCECFFDVFFFYFEGVEWNDISSEFVMKGNSGKNGEMGIWKNMSVKKQKKIYDE